MIATIKINKWLSVDNEHKTPKEVVTHRFKDKIEAVVHISGYFVVGGERGEIYVVDERDGTYMAQHIGSPITNIEHFPGSGFVIVSTSNNKLFRVNVINMHCIEVNTSTIFNNTPVTLMKGGVVDRVPVVYITTPNIIAIVDVQGTIIMHRNLMYSYPSSLQILTDVVVVYYDHMKTSEDLEKKTLIRFGIDVLNNSILYRDHQSGSILYEDPSGLCVRPNQDTDIVFNLPEQFADYGFLENSGKIAITKTNSHISFFDVYFQTLIRRITIDKAINTFDFSNDTLFVGFDGGFTIFKL